jgi:hypothetical protein
MSGLAAVLADRRNPGVYRWSSPAGVKHVEHVVKHAGWSFVHLDTWTIEDKDAFLAATAEAFGFVDEIRSWDALLDALRDVRSEHGTVVLWDGWSPFARAAQPSFSVALDVFRQRSDTRRGGALAVLMRGDGPRVDVPDVDPHEAG